MKVARLEGFGTAFLGVKRDPRRSYHTATVWVTFFYAPILPLRRYRVKFGEDGAYTLMKRTPLSFAEVLECYVWCWMILPVVLLGPLFLGITEIWESVGLPHWAQIPYILSIIAWICVAMWKLADRYDRSMQMEV